ncbi:MULTISPECIES: macrolide family glycosyltransferase [Pseudonocardia]|uniref:Oleandomycin glycosyltransferase n=2 Tax=Pseudonocardia TaxID=1847 RepID=A0A1Y2MRT0_PSEAH|nr:MULTISPECIES: macrolide family glycosyltransferase [Pseudonocardia]OSY37208.1 Oleandomycin glycosyltransferase [Pseudonocardia autotrophica]TDN74829.1 MGT family glycosyltransferase [Pseudonocardia autotrophica]BBG05604.1 glycosyl transferase [Pseudonocardia autotrophica]GEC25855.1 glycosyl transferase [Pseudonocardia saturnea]
MATVSHYVPLGAGHVNPTIGIVAELVRRGHRVSCFVPERFAEQLTGTGARIVPVPSTWEAAGLADPPQMHGRHLVRAMGYLLEETRMLVPLLARHPAPDLVLHDGVLAIWGRVLAQRWTVPSVEVWPNLVSNRHWSMNRYSKVNPLGPRFLAMMMKYALYLRGEGIRDIREFFEGGAATQRLVTVPRAFQYAGETFENFRFVGPVLGDRAAETEGWTPPEDGRPVLLASLGSAYNRRPDLYRTILSATAGRGWHVVLSIGEVDPAELGPLPADVEVHRRVPQVSVLRHATVFVTHAGMGGTMEGLAAGVPLVALPQMAEQRANADRIAELGLGRALDPATVTADQLWAAVRETAADPGIRERLNRMAGEIAAAGGASAAADEIERALPRQD